MRERRLIASSLSVVDERHRVELEPVIDDPVAEPAGDLGLQRLDLLGAELDDVAGLEVDEVVVVLAGRLLVAGAAVAEIEPLDDALGLEELHGAVDRRERDALVDRRRAAVQLDDVGMVRGLIEDAGDDPALAGHAQAALAAGALDRLRPPTARDLRVPTANPMLLAAYRPRLPDGEAALRGRRS